VPQRAPLDSRDFPPACCVCIAGDCWTVGVWEGEGVRANTDVREAPTMVYNIIAPTPLCAVDQPTATADL
jgi:hypothetical protein